MYKNTQGCFHVLHRFISSVLDLAIFLAHLAGGHVSYWHHYASVVRRRRRRRRL